MKRYCLVVVLLLLLQSVLPGEQVLPLLKEGESTPVFMLPSLNGERVSLRDYCGQLRNPWKNKNKHITILSFMASYCVPCRHEIPQLEAFAAEAPSDVRVVFISVDTLSNEEIASFVKKMDMKQTVLSDRYGNVMKKYGVQKLPSLFILDKEGNLFFQSLNGLPPDMDLKSALNKKIEALCQAEKALSRPPLQTPIMELSKELKTVFAKGLVDGKSLPDLCRDNNLTPEQAEALKTEIMGILQESWESR